METQPPSQRDEPHAKVDASRDGKARARRELRAAVASLSPARRAEASAALTRRILALPEFAGAKVVMLFCPDIEREPQVLAVVRRALAMGKLVALPRMEWRAGAMDAAAVAAPLRGGSARTGPRGLGLVPAGRGLFQPGRAARAVQPTDINVAIIPGVGFDVSGRRLGRGAGFYDRFLSLLPTTATKVGVGFDEQVVGTLPSDRRDVGMDVIVTPTRTMRIRPSP